MPETNWQRYLGDPDQPSMYVFALKSLKTALGDTDISHRERRFIVERLEGKPREIKEATLTLTDLSQSPLASSIRDACLAITERVMIEPGPDARKPDEGATYAEIIRKPSQMDKDAYDLAREVLDGNAQTPPQVPAMDKLVAKVAVDMVLDRAPQADDDTLRHEFAGVQSRGGKRRHKAEAKVADDGEAAQGPGAGGEPPFDQQNNIADPPHNFGAQDLL